MLKDSERYILTTDKASVIRDVLPLVSAAIKSELRITPDTCRSLDAFAKSCCDGMILEPRKPKEPPTNIYPWVKKPRVSRLGRVLVVTRDATFPEILNVTEVPRRPHFPSQHLTSSLRAPGRTLFGTLRVVHPQS